MYVKMPSHACQKRKRLYVIDRPTMYFSARKMYRKRKNGALQKEEKAGCTLATMYWRVRHGVACRPRPARLDGRAGYIFPVRRRCTNVMYQCLYLRCTIPTSPSSSVYFLYSGVLDLYRMYVEVDWHGHSKARWRTAAANVRRLSSCTSPTVRP